MEQIGIIGLGRMGSAMATRIAGQGRAVRGWTRSGRAVDGIPSAPDIETLVAESGTLILSLFDDDAVAEVLDLLLQLDLNGKTIIETSTVIPAILQARADQMAAAGAIVVDAPISGGPELVLSGECGIFVGGDPAAYERASETLRLITDRVLHLGPLGAGLVMKAVNNGMLQTYFAGMAEFMPMAREAGLPLETTLRILCGGPAGLPMVTARIPRILGEDDSVGFALNAVQKDADVFRRMLTSYGLPTPVMSRFEQLSAEMVDAGLGDRDAAELVRHAYLIREKDNATKS